MYIIIHNCVHYSSLSKIQNYFMFVKLGILSNNISNLNFCNSSVRLFIIHKKNLQIIQLFKSRKTFSIAWLWWSSWNITDTLVWIKKLTILLIFIIHPILAPSVMLTSLLASSDWWDVLQMLFQITKISTKSVNIILN